MKPKFRAWDKAHEIMRDVLSIDFINRSIICETAEDNDIKLYDMTYELLQSTGLKDKNGIEIFYDDIVKVSYKEHSYVSYITYEFHETTIEGKYIHEDFHYYENPLYVIFEDDDNDHTIEVIGNIYEHPHLLKE